MEKTDFVLTNEIVSTVEGVLPRIMECCAAYRRGSALDDEDIALINWMHDSIASDEFPQ